MFYVYQDFGKKDRKRLSDLVGFCANREAGKFLKENFSLYQSIVEKDHEDFRKPYWEIADKFKDFSKHLTKKYDGYSHRDIPMMIAKALLDGLINEEDIKDFSDEGKIKLKEMKTKLASY